ncbi:MAG TPA: DUF1015 family protein [Vicinamibacterales bacterium]|nr:DUF1015 family protein [Vicinamibacterales bacterium]
MAVLHPFRALRPAPEAAPHVSSVPYDVVSTEEARQLAAGNPLSFLHVTRSEVDLPPEADPYSPQVYALARRNLDALRSRAPLVVDDIASLYCYRLKMGSHEQTGVAGCFSVDEYERDVIRKHERTRSDKEDDRTRHIVELRAQTGLVFLTYHRTADVDAIQRRVTEGQPLYHFTAADGVQHTVWRASADDTRALVQAFGRVPALYIADGHHRAASAARARAELRAGTAAPSEIENASRFIAVAFPHNQVQILPYHRVVGDLAGQTPEAFLEAVRARVPVTDGPAVPRRTGEVSMHLAGRWYSIDLAGAGRADDSRASGLDVALLQRHVLEPVLAVGDIRTDTRIDFVGGSRGIAALEQAVREGRATVAFSMFPVGVDDLMTIADAGGIMPPKSTWFEPKLRDGLLVHQI